MSQDMFTEIYGKSWRSVTANIFGYLYEDKNAHFQMLGDIISSISVTISVPFLYGLG